MKYKINYVLDGGVTSPPRRKLARPARRISYNFNNRTLREAVELWCRDKEGKAEATNIYGHISTWNVSEVTDMSNLFEDKNNFNENINKWNVSKVTNMSLMFHNIYPFNQPLDSWDVSSVTDMSGMFGGVVAFNQSLNSWDVSSVTNMSDMFFEASSFNQPLDSWNVSSVTNMSRMFNLAIKFNKPINTQEVTIKNKTYKAWDVSSVNNMSYMFSGASLFNQPIDSWDVSSVTDMRYMFNGALSFNKNIGLWVIQDNCDITGIFINSGITGQTFLPIEQTNPGEYETGRGIYGIQIANSFDPPLPNPKTNNELIEIRRRNKNWERRKKLVLSLEASKTNAPSTGLSGNIIKLPDELQRRIVNSLGGSNN